MFMQVPRVLLAQHLHLLLHTVLSAVSSLLCGDVRRLTSGPGGVSLATNVKQISAQRSLSFLRRDNDVNIANFVALKSVECSRFSQGYLAAVSQLPQSCHWQLRSQ